MNYSSFGNILSQYINNNYFLGLVFLLAIFYYILKSAVSNQNCALFPLFSITTFLLIFFNPFLYTKVFMFFDADLSYYRFLWIIPTIALTACFLTEIVFFASSDNKNLSPKPLSNNYTEHSLVNNTEKKILAILLSTILCTSLLIDRPSYLSSLDLTVPENKFNISRATLDISQFIHDDPDHKEGDVVLAPTEIMMELLAYDSTIVPALSRNEYINYKKTDSVYEPLLSLILEGPESTWHHFENVKYNCKALNVEYIVTLTLFDLDRYMDFLDYPLYNRTGDYSLYKRRDK